MQIGIAGTGHHRAHARAPARRRRAGTDARRRSRRATRRRRAAGSTRRGSRCRSSRSTTMPAHAELAVECAPAEDHRGDLPADAHRRQAGDGALLRRAAAAPRTASNWRSSNGGRIVVPTGGLLGLDAVAAAAEGTIHSVKMTTRKPPNGLAGAPHLRQEQHLGRRAERGQARILRHARARRRRAFRPTSTSRRRSRSPASGRTAR